MLFLLAVKDWTLRHLSYMRWDEIVACGILSRVTVATASRPTCFKHVGLWCLHKDYWMLTYVVIEAVHGEQYNQFQSKSDKGEIGRRLFALVISLLVENHTASKLTSQTTLPAYLLWTDHNLFISRLTANYSSLFASNGEIHSATFVANVICWQIATIWIKFWYLSVTVGLYIVHSVWMLRPVSSQRRSAPLRITLSLHDPLHPSTRPYTASKVSLLSHEILTLEKCSQGFCISWYFFENDVGCIFFPWYNFCSS